MTTQPADEFDAEATKIADSFNPILFQHRGDRNRLIAEVSSSLRTLVQRKVREHNEECAKVADEIGQSDLRSDLVVGRAIRQLLPEQEEA